MVLLGARKLYLRVGISHAESKVDINCQQNIDNTLTWTID